MKQLLLPVFFLLCFPTLLRAQYNAHDSDMNKPVAPFRIIGNIYYVGASDVTSYLITTPKGHILIDGGFESTAQQIEANIARLGFKLEDVKILLINHAHYDHCGGLAELKRRTGAKLYASPADAPVLRDGGKSDFAFGGPKPLFPPVWPGALLQDGQEIRLGDVVLTTHFTPGHTKGATSWTMYVPDHGKSYKVVFASSVSTLDYSLVNNKKYPEIAADFSRTFETLRGIHPDVFLGSHGDFFDLLGKAKRLREGASPNPFIDPTGYSDFVTRTSKAFQDRLKASGTKAKN